MPLLDLKTDLKSLKYGKDRPGGGNSGQPYQKVDINTVDSGFNRFRMTKFDDGLVRGGFVGAVNASVVDTLRIGKFLTDFPKGPLFIVKQVGLQLSNPRLEAKKLKTDNPTTGGGLFRNVGNFVLNTANKLVNAVGPTRLYNLGINTLAQVPVNAFGVHFNRHGLLPVQDDQTKYLAVAQNNNEGANAPNNRLVILKNRFRLGDNETDKRPEFNNRKQRKVLAQNINNVVFGGIIKNPKPIGFLNANKELTIDRYIGGPQSVYGIGNTTILRKTFTEDSGKIDEAKAKNYIAQHLPEVKINQTWDFGVSTFSNSGLSKVPFDLLTNSNTTLSGSFINNIASANDISNPKYIASGSEASASAKMRNPNAFVGVSKNRSSIFVSNNFPDLTNQVNKPTTLEDKTISTYNSSFVGGYLTASNDLGTGNKAISNYNSSIATDPNSINIGIDQTVIPYSPSGKTYSDLKKQVDKNTEFKNYNSSNSSLASITVNVNRGATNFKYVDAELDNKFKRTNDINVNSDTLALIFNPLDPFTGNILKTIKFLGYLSDYSEDYNSTWNPVKYVGRAENFYIFTEFKRTLSVSFQIPCFNQQELVDKHCALSELASTLAGKYENNLLGGIITRLKVGNYINNQPGIITNLNFAPIQESSWDLDIQLAYYIKVSFGFTVIHDYLPQYYNCGFTFKQYIPDPKPKENTDNNTTTTTTTTNNNILAVGTGSTVTFPPGISTSNTKPSNFRGYGGGSFGGGGAGGSFGDRGAGGG